MTIQTGKATFSSKTIYDSVAKLTENSPIRVKEMLGGDKRLKLKELANVGGVYAFWWTGDHDLLKNKINRNEYKLKGPSNRSKLISVTICDDWIDSATHQNRVCLYVGKSTNLKQRILGHLKYTVEDIWTQKGTLGAISPFSFEKKPNTVSQLRIGLERIFQENSLEYIKEHIAISWIELRDTEERNNAVNRFYIEDKLISHLFPIFNVDVER